MRVSCSSLKIVSAKSGIPDKELEHTLSVEQRSIPCLLTGIHVHPSPAMCAVDFGPDMVFYVPHPSYSAANGSAEHRKAVRPLTHTSSPCLEQYESVVVSGKPFK